VTNRQVAVLNAIVHRDYSTGNPIHIHIYPDKVLIYNDGRLPEHWTVDNLFAPHTSKPHNPLIAGAFFRSGQIEAWGRGIEKITEACKEWNKPEPFYKVSANEVMIGFYADVAIPNKDTIRDTNKDTNRDTLNGTQNELLKTLIGNPHITIKQISIKLAINERNVKKNIKTLKDAGYVERISTTRSGHWMVKAGSNTE
jgi:ATP-dependent DNA helicase RecG